jgi:hypothetical protein
MATKSKPNQWAPKFETSFSAHTYYPHIKFLTSPAKLAEKAHLGAQILGYWLVYALSTRICAKNILIQNEFGSSVIFLIERCFACFYLCVHQRRALCLCNKVICNLDLQAGVSNYFAVNFEENVCF